MPAHVKTLEEYLRDLEGGKEDRPEQVKDGIEIYVSLWRRAIEKGVVRPGDDLGEALEKVEGAGGLRAAAED